MQRYCVNGSYADCNMKCGGEYCGGYLANDVYYSPGLYQAVLRRFIAAG